MVNSISISRIKADLPHYLFLLFVFTIPILPTQSVKLLMLVVIAVLFILYPRLNCMDYFRKSWDLLFYFLILIIGLLWSADILSGIKVLETNLCLLGVAIFFGAFKRITMIQLKQIFNSFIIGVLFACLICTLRATVNYFNEGNLEAFFYYKFTGIIKSHPTYLAYYIIFSISWILYQLYNDLIKSRLLLIGNYIFLIFLFSMLILTGGQTAFISLFFIFSFFGLKYFMDDFGTNKRRVIYLICIMTCVLFLIKSTILTRSDFRLDDTWERYILWESAIHANPDFLLGVGTGDYKAVMNDYYTTHDLNQFVASEYNSHNQFIQILLSNGVIGLLSVVLMIIRPLYLSYKIKNVYGVLVLFPFVIYGVTEVFLGRYQGVVFFAIMHQSFVSNYYSTSLETMIGNDVSVAK